MRHVPALCTLQNKLKRQTENCFRSGRNYFYSGERSAEWPDLNRRPFDWKFFASFLQIYNTVLPAEFRCRVNCRVIVPANIHNNEKAPIGRFQFVANSVCYEANLRDFAMEVRYVYVSTLYLAWTTLVCSNKHIVYVFDFTTCGALCEFELNIFDGRRLRKYVRIRKVGHGPDTSECITFRSVVGYSASGGKNCLINVIRNENSERIISRGL